MTVTNT